MGWTRVDMRSVLTVVVRPGATATELDVRCRAIGRALDAHYAPVLTDCRTSWAVLPQEHAAVLVTASSGPSTVSLPLVWGLPVGADGEATDAELNRLVRKPAPEASLLGAFVAVARLPDGLRVVTSADLMHVLAGVDGVGCRAWSTKSWAALLATDSRARLAPTRIPEYVVFDQVFCGDELLRGATTLPEAWRGDVQAGVVSECSWWPPSDRWRRGKPTSGEDLRTAVIDELGRIGRTPGLQVGLTAGRDSTLVAVALAAAGASVDTYTFGAESWPDVRAARATAAALGLRHRMWAAPAPEPPSVHRAVERTAWTEGLDTAANLVYPALLWDGPGDVVLLSGNGGETGRAFYYGTRNVPSTTAEVVNFLAGGLLDILPAVTGDACRSRLDAAVAAAADLAGGAGPRALDILYASTRMRSWLARSVPPAHARAAVAAFTSPRLTRILLDLPEAARRDSSAFDEALGTDGLRLRAAGPMDRVSVGVRVHQMVTRRIDRVRGAHRVARITRRWGGGVDHGTVQTLRSLFDEVGTFAARAAMGEVWWADSWDKAAYSPDVRRQLWNALAVDLLAQRAPAEG